LAASRLVDVCKHTDSRKVERRYNFHARVWSKRLQHEIARWS